MASGGRAVAGMLLDLAHEQGLLSTHGPFAILHTFPRWSKHRDLAASDHGGISTERAQPTLGRLAMIAIKPEIRTQFIRSDIYDPKSRMLSLEQTAQHIRGTPNMRAERGGLSLYRKLTVFAILISGATLALVLVTVESLREKYLPGHITARQYSTPPTLYEVCIKYPIFETLIYQHGVFVFFRRWTPPSRIIFISMVLFSASHYDSSIYDLLCPGIIGGASLAFAYALLSREGLLEGLIGTVMLHAFANGVLFLPFYVAIGVRRT
jgi:hypothetical protein